MTYYESLVEDAKGKYAAYAYPPGRWDRSMIARKLAKSADLGKLLTEDTGMLLECIDDGVYIELDDDGYQNRAVSVSLEDVLRELLIEKLQAALQQEADTARMVRRDWAGTR